ncbi:hypothetical protein FRE64_07640 [Euhalothece natronophila Z-M001]|uniref:Sacsin/Nov domain-containing protein n=1 Tax=Euhalothece natronophila Z-M001 TaxID=522448 RepID=A0A5B8NLB1_9CHRO|nr:ATP-binding protein [Euhalothece natronophila]QDZ39824.1 hypothetical protein FRE64_07640 [Euhalothece natronophila Z-M001]
MARHHPLQDIKDLRDSLLDNYPPQAILKELIQNAEDANSTCFDYGWSRGIKDAKHPLLKSSGIFILDNGKFTLEDADNIRYFKGSGKHKEDKSEQDFIGKFGLGLKSVFHICEAFFYISNWTKKQDENGDTIWGYGFFNPWADNYDEDKYHHNWTNLCQSDRNLVEQEIQPILRKEDYIKKSWLLIWIPLRKQTHKTNDRENKYGWIKQKFYEDKNNIDCLFNKEETKYQLALLLPLLRYLTKIRYWNNKISKTVFEVSNSNKHKQPIKNIPANKVINNSGYIKFNDQQNININISFHFCSSEIRPTELKKDVLNFKNHDQSFDQEIEKTTPYIEIALTRLPNLNDDNNLNIRTAIFLPTEQNCQLSIKSKDKYLITLNGSFFPDSSRKGILGFNPDNFQIEELNQDSRIIWNKKLYDKLLSILLKALEYFYKELQSDLDENLDQEIAALCQGLNNSLLKTNQDIICQNYCWIYRLKPDYSRWELISTNKRIIALPSFVNDLWIELPTLKDFADKYYLTVKEKPNLIKEDQLNTFEASELVNLFESINSKSIFQSQELKEFLFQFLEEFKEQLSINAVKYLLKKIRKFLNPNQDTANLISKIINYLGNEDIDSITLSYIPVYSLKQKSNYYCHPNELQNKIDKSLVFKYNNQNKKIRDALQAVLEKEALILIDENLAQQLWSQKIKTFSDKACFDILCQKPRLTTDSDKRKKLVKQLQDSNHSKKKQVIRFLLHSSIEHFDDSSTPLYVQPLSINQVWKKIASYTLPPWQVLDTQLAHNIPEEQWQSFNIEPILPDSLIRQLTPEKITGDILPSREEREEVLSEIAKKKDNKNFWKRLPLHETVDSYLVSINEKTYLNNRKFPLDQYPELRSLVTLIDEKYTNQPEWIPLWSPTEAVKLVLQQNQPEQYDQLLLKVLHKYCDNVCNDKELLNQLKNTPWLKLSKGGSICPNQLIFLGERIQNLTSVIEEAFCNESQVDYVINTQLPNSIPQEQINLLKNKLSPTWYENDLLKFLLDKTYDPSTYCKAILDLLKSIYKNKQKIRNENFEKLKQSHWLIDKKNQSLSPQQICYLPNLNDKYTEILKQFSSWDYITPKLLKEELNINLYLEYSQFKNLFLSEKTSIQKLGDAIAQLPQYYIGNVDLELKELSQVLSNCELMPIWEIYFQVPQQQFKSDILPKVKKPVSDIEWLCKLLKWMTASYQKPNEDVIKVYNNYLKLFINSGANLNQKIKNLAELKLLNKNFDWQDPKSLCVPKTYGINKTYLIDDNQYQIIKQLLNYQSNYTPSDLLEYQQSTNNSNEQKTNAETLKEYFKDWINTTSISPPVIGLFLMIFYNNDDEIKELAQNFLGKHSFDNIYSILFRDPIRNPNSEKCDLKITISTENKITVKNLFNAKFYVDVLQHNPTNLFIGELNKSNEIILKQITANKLSKENLENILFNSIKEWLKTYNNDISSIKLDSRIDNQLKPILIEAQKLEIYNARDFIIENCSYTLRVLEINNKSLIDTMEQIDDKRYDRLSLEKQTPIIKNNINNVSAEIKRKIKSIQDTIKNNTDVQNDLLVSVRKKIQNFGYSNKSVLFELFQNADDAALERNHFLNSNDYRYSKTEECVISLNSSELELIHWGRPINQFSDPTLNKRLQGKGYQRDLVKMLSFNISDKNEEATGEFGLGFKTVYLLTDCPKVHSGNLSFQVNGGILPEPITDLDEIQKLQKRIKQFQQPDQDSIDGTIIKLPISARNDRQLIQSIINEFKSYTHLILAFAKKIKSCRIESDQVKTIKWEPEKVLGIDGIECDVVQNQPTLCFRLKKGQVAIALPRKLDDDEDSFLREMPTFWVTVPTKELLSLRFVVNSQFDINPGRTSLDPNSTDNQELISEIGEQLGEKLCQLFQASQGNWETLHQQIGLDEQVNPYQFWEFLWKVLAVDWLDKLDEQHKSELLKNGFGGEYNGVGHLISCHPTLPNGLYGDYRQLVCFTELAYVVTGILKQQEIFEIVSPWSQFQQHYQPNCLVHEDIWQYLQRLLQTDEPDELESLTLQKVIEKQLGDNNISPENASQIGQLIEIIENWYSNEIQEINNFFSSHSILFMNKEKEYYPATSLLTPHSSDQEEQYLVQFAPLERILHEDYNNQALKFFFKCRSQRKTIEIAELVEWAKQASTEKQKQAVRNYLLEGNYKEGFEKQLKQKYKGSWIEKDEGIQRILEFNQTKAKVKQANKGECSWNELDLDDSNQSQDSSYKDIKSVDVNQVQKSLEDLSSWWNRHYQDKLKKYNRELYPTEIENLKYGLKQRDREAWLILFFIGITHTMGRTIKPQHKGFIELCEEKGWWETFKQPNPQENSEKWFKVLDEYIEKLKQDTKWYYWMEKYPHIYQISKYLDVYQDLFLKADRWSQKWGNQFSLQKLVSPRSNEQLSGGGLDAPPLSIGMGANFVLRELIRLEVIEPTPDLIPYCFVPRKQIRENLSYLGCQNIDQENYDKYDKMSKSIYYFLEKNGVEDCTFNNSFDIAIELYWKY